MIKVSYVKTMWAEMKPDVYGGKNADEHIPRWEAFCLGDRGSELSSADLILDPKLFPPGTKIEISEPICPKCGEVYQNCMSRGYNKDECDFDWKEWAEDQYS